MAGLHRFDRFKIRVRGYGKDEVEKTVQYNTLEEAEAEIDYRRNAGLTFLYDYSVVRRDRTRPEPEAPTPFG